MCPFTQNKLTRPRGLVNSFAGGTRTPRPRRTGRRPANAQVGIISGVPHARLGQSPAPCGSPGTQETGATPGILARTPRLTKAGLPDPNTSKEADLRQAAPALSAPLQRAGQETRPAAEMPPDLAQVRRRMTQPARSRQAQNRRDGCGRTFIGVSVVVVASWDGCTQGTACLSESAAVLFARTPRQD